MNCVVVQLCWIGALSLVTVSALAEPVSDYAFLDPSTQAMQIGEFENPGTVATDHGEERFHELREAEEYRCSDCHGDDAEGLNPAHIARYPVFNAGLGGLLTLQKQINHCWEINMDRCPLLSGDDQLMIAVETFLRHRARGEAERPADRNAGGSLLIWAWPKTKMRICCV